MPHIYDNIQPPQLFEELRRSLSVAYRADYCVGYFNLRGWGAIDEQIDRWKGGEGQQCRLLIGMQRLPEDELRRALAIDDFDRIDAETARRMRREAAEAFRKQLTFGVPDNQAEVALRRLASQLRARKLVVKLHTRHTLHAKLYLHFREDHFTPVIGYVGSSNLTMAGLRNQGELNLDVVENDACSRLEEWFIERWNDQFSLDISLELAEIIEQSWARPDPVPPQLIYLKMAYHLSREDSLGTSAFEVPADLQAKLLKFQLPAVQRAVRLLRAQHGVVIGDVVGLGKTLMATAVARVFQDSEGAGTLILCPKNLERMWQDYRHEYGLIGDVIPTSMAARRLPQLRARPHQLVIIDESHNFRNREGKTYQAVKEWVQQHADYTILLSATPYNTGYLDLGSQLGVFLDQDTDLEIRPEAYIRSLGGPERFNAKHEAGITTLGAFELSNLADDWREIMTRFMVRRTRSFVMQTYGETDQDGRVFLRYANGATFYFPERVPKNATFDIDPSSQFARLFEDNVVNTISRLSLPRYGLAGYIDPRSRLTPTHVEDRIIDDLGRAGQRLIGFCRTGLFKRLESSGPAFVLSLERHALRNFVFLHAIQNGLELPIGTQDAAFLDEAQYDDDRDPKTDDPAESDGNGSDPTDTSRTAQDYLARAAQVYDDYRRRYSSRYRWIRPGLFRPELADHLLADAKALMDILDACGPWVPANDAKLAKLEELIQVHHPGEKLLVFSQFADTVHYLEQQLAKRGAHAVVGVTGGSSDPTALAYRFSPKSNGKEIDVADQIRVLLATDVLSEGQNLQDARIIVNYDLPWALVRLIQRAGRVDRIGQEHPEVLCYSFLPADGIEDIIQLRARVRRRLHEQGEVVGSDERFFEDQDEVVLRDLYSEKAGIFDPKDDPDDVDLGSLAYSVWKKAIDEDPSVEATVKALPDVVYSARAFVPSVNQPEGVLTFLRTKNDVAALVWVDTKGEVVSQSPLQVFRAAECAAGTPAVPRSEAHHSLVRKAVEVVQQQGVGTVGGQLGRKTAVRYRVYERLKHFHTSAATPETASQLGAAVDDIYKFPLRQVARDILNRELRGNVSDDALVQLAIDLHKEGRLTQRPGDDPSHGDATVEVVCSMGLVASP